MSGAVRAPEWIICRRRCRCAGGRPAQRAALEAITARLARCRAGRPHEPVSEQRHWTRSAWYVCNYIHTAAASDMSPLGQKKRRKKNSKKIMGLKRNQNPELYAKTYFLNVNILKVFRVRFLPPSYTRKSLK